MATKERPADHGRRVGRELYARAAHEQRQARIERGLSLDVIGGAVGLSGSEVSRIERGLVPATSVVRLAELHATVGLELRIQSLPGGQPIRDASQADLLGRFRGRLHRAWRWAAEVPSPILATFEPGTRWSGCQAVAKASRSRRPRTTVRPSVDGSDSSRGTAALTG